MRMGLLKPHRYELQRRLDSDPELSNICILGYDPGWVGATTIFRDQASGVRVLMSILRKLMGEGRVSNRGCLGSSGS